VAVIPEPAPAILLSAGMALIVCLRRCCARQAKGFER
jgi:hypothetical protein